MRDNVGLKSTPTNSLFVRLLQEKKAVEERLIKMGERDDTLPPEYRPTEEDLKVIKHRTVLNESLRHQ